MKLKRRDINLPDCLGREYDEHVWVWNWWKVTHGGLWTRIWGSEPA